jgi:hypothetical protein
VRDDTLVSVELISAEANVTQPSEIALYVKAFEQLRGMAVYGAEARALIVKAIDALGQGTFQRGEDSGRRAASTVRAPCSRGPAHGRNTVKRANARLESQSSALRVPPSTSMHDLRHYYASVLILRESITTV